MSKAVADAKATVEVKAEEVKVVTLEECMADINECLANINKAIIDDDSKAKKAAEELLEEYIKEYNAMLRKKEYDKFLTEEHPVLTALTQGSVAQIKRKNVKGKDGAPDKVEIADTWAVVDLIEMNDYTDEKIFVSGQWIQRISLWNNALKAWKSKDLGDTEAHHAMKELIKSLERDEDVEANFVFSGTISKNLLIKTAQVIADNIVTNPVADAKPFIFEGKDVEYIALAFKPSRKDILQYAAIRDNTCITMFTRAMHRIVTGGTYKAEEMK